MATTKVLRIEHSTHADEDTGYPTGPYRYAFPIGFVLCRDHGCDDDHAAPSWALMDSYHLCGVQDLDELVHWFSGYFNRLDEQGFILATYEVSSRYAERTNGQTIFVWSEAALVATESLAYLASVYPDYDENGAL